MPLWFLSVSQQSNSHKTVLTSHFRLRAAAAPLHPEGATPSAKRPWSLSLSDPERGRRACAFSSLFSDDALHGRSGWRVGRGRRAAAGGMTRFSLIVRRAPEAGRDGGGGGPRAVILF